MIRKFRVKAVVSAMVDLGDIRARSFPEAESLAAQVTADKLGSGIHLCPECSARLGHSNLAVEAALATDG